MKRKQCSTEGCCRTDFYTSCNNATNCAKCSITIKHGTNRWSSSDGMDSYWTLPYPVWEPYYGMWVPYPPIPFAPFHLGWGAPQKLVFDRLSEPVNDRLSTRQSGPSELIFLPGQHEYWSNRSGGSVRPVLQEKVYSSPKQVYHAKGKDPI